MARIKKVSDKSYRIVVFLGRDVDGKEINSSCTYHPQSKSEKAVQKEVNNYARDFERRVLEGEYYEGEKITFRDFASKWDKEWASDHLTQSIRESYNANLRIWAFKHIGHIPVAKIRASHLQSLIQKMKEEGKATKTIKTVFASISSVLKYAYKLEVIKENPVLRCEFPKEDSDNKLHYFTLEQAKTFLNALDDEYSSTYSAHERTLERTGTSWMVKDYEEKHRIGTQWKAFFTLAIYGGFRRGELLALSWEDIDFENKTISVSKAMARVKGGQVLKAPKTKAGNRILTMPPQCFQILKKWKREEYNLCLAMGSEWLGFRGKEFDKNFIFIQMDSGRGMHLDSPRNRFVTIIEMYNAKCEKEEDKLPLIRLHDLRHTSATLLLSENVDIETVSHRLGHSKASVTLDVYGHALETKDAVASEKLETLFA